MKLIVLDRDGVINRDSDNFIRTLDEWIPIDGSIEAMARLSRAGYAVYVATNQSGLARGYLTSEILDSMHARLEQLVAEAGGRIAGIFYCPHGPDDGCDCRKPLPGLFRRIEAHSGHSLSGAPTIGDSLRDLQAGAAVGCTPILVLTGKGERTLAKGEGIEGVPVYDDLAAAVDALLTEGVTA